MGFPDPHRRKQSDFLINYEHKARELESVCLIKCELERRGYTVALSNTYDEQRISFRERRKARVVLTPALYNDASLFAFVYRVAGACRKVVNLQWEQALTNRDESDPVFYQNPKGRATQAVHLCWGEEPRKRLMRAGVPAAKAKVVGPIQMDTLRPQMAALFLTKEAIAEEFQLPVDGEWVLFISSFTFTNMPSEEFETEVSCLGDWLYEYRDISVASQAMMLEWFSSACEAHPDRTFIYRPHPSETRDPSLAVFERRFQNFRVIADHSVRQWIQVSERIYTWYSTSAAEVLFSRKTCAVVRPVPIPDALDVSIFRGAVKVETLDAFLLSLRQAEPAFPLDADLIRTYFAVDQSEPSFMKTCDLLEEVYKTDRHDMPRLSPLQAQYHYIQWIRHRFFFLLKELLVRTPLGVLPRRLDWVRERIENHEALMHRMNADRGKNLATLAEIAEVEEIIRNARWENVEQDSELVTCLSSS